MFDNNLREMHPIFLLCTVLRLCYRLKVDSPFLLIVKAFPVFLVS